MLINIGLLVFGTNTGFDLPLAYVPLGGGSEKCSTNIYERIEVSYMVIITEEKSQILRL